MSGVAAERKPPALAGRTPCSQRTFPVGGVSVDAVLGVTRLGGRSSASSRWGGVGPPGVSVPSREHSHRGTPDDGHASSVYYGCCPRPPSPVPVPRARSCHL